MVALGYRLPLLITLALDSITSVRTTVFIGLLSLSTVLFARAADKEDKAAA